MICISAWNLPFRDRSNSQKLLQGFLALNTPPHHTLDSQVKIAPKNITLTYDYVIVLSDDPELEHFLSQRVIF